MYLDTITSKFATWANLQDLTMRQPIDVGPAPGLRHFKVATLFSAKFAGKAKLIGQIYGLQPYPWSRSLSLNRSGCGSKWVTDQVLSWVHGSYHLYN